ncbi:MAG: YbaK/prolyl-tRNA synthetase associated region [Chloroflexi bacterium]|nr:YbaK/prolyl-tRNA synthetase associated region [Chloroflexota bacterium]
MDEEQDRDLKPSVQRVATALRALGVAPQIVEFTESTRTAEDAARALGTSVERIVKSLVFTAGGAPLLVLVSGVNRVAVDRLREALGVEVRRADASVVREATGFAIGGVPPIGHATQLPVILDRDLMQYELVYAAAGTPNSVFPITPQDLHRITGARVLDVKEQAG